MLYDTKSLCCVKDATNDQFLLCVLDPIPEIDTGAIIVSTYVIEGVTDLAEARQIAELAKKVSMWLGRAIGQLKQERACEVRILRVPLFWGGVTTLW